MRFEIFMGVKMSVLVSWIVTLCRLIGRCLFAGTFQPWKWVKAVCSNILESTYKSKWCYNPEDQHWHILADYLLFTQSSQKLNISGLSPWLKVILKYYLTDWHRMLPCHVRSCGRWEMLQCLQNTFFLCCSVKVQYSLSLCWHWGHSSCWHTVLHCFCNKLCRAV
jgi:hypothetical protein